MKLSEVSIAHHLNEERMRVKELLRHLSHRPSTMMFKWPVTVEQDNTHQKTGRTGPNIPSWLVPQLRAAYEKAARNQLQHLNNVLKSMGVELDD